MRKNLTGLYEENFGNWKECIFCEGTYTPGRLVVATGEKMAICKLCANRLKGELKNNV